MKKSALVAAAALAVSMGGGGVPSINVASPAVDSERSNAQSSKATNVNKRTHAKKRMSAARLTSSNNYGRYRFLKPVNKESFKQARRKQLAKKSYRKAKKKGQA